MKPDTSVARCVNIAILDLGTLGMIQNFWNLLLCICEDSVLAEIVSQNGATSLLLYAEKCYNDLCKPQDAMGLLI